MAMGLSFADSFFFGYGEDDYPEKSDRPTYVMQAIESLDDAIKREISRKVLGTKAKLVEYDIKSEDFNHRVLDKIRETDRCDDATSPITVYIDAEGYYSVTVYSEDEDN